MTPIEELCARLDELEIKHRKYGYKNHVWWEGKDGVDWHAENRSSVKDPYVIVDAVITPEQAIAATVGNVGYGIQFADCCEFPPETMVGETVFDGGGNAIGWIVNATVGETCRLVDNESGPNIHCTKCGREVDDEYRYFMESYGYSRCPHCGRRIEVSE